MTVAHEAYSGGHAFISHRTPGQIAIAMEVCQSFAVDNGAFPAWREGRPITDWRPFYAWLADVKDHPCFDFAVIPDVIDGDESANDALVAEWPYPKWVGAPVWHMHESFDRLERLASEWPRICLGSSGEFATVGTDAWWFRMHCAMSVVCDSRGYPRTKLHGLRMLNPKIFSQLPFASADSTNIGRNVGIDKAWRGTYQPTTKEAKARVMRQRIESINGAQMWPANRECSNAV